MISKLWFYNKSTRILYWGVIILLSLLPLGLARFGLEYYFSPQIEIGITFFLSIYFSIKPWKLFLYGIFIDVAYGTPLGITSFILLLLNHIITKFKLYLSKQDISRLLIYFSQCIICVDLIKHCIFVLYFNYHFEANYIDILINIIINIIFYPFLHLFLLKKPNY